MRVWTTIPEWLQHRASIEGKTIGFVPTMGALHRGHASLVERCRRDNDLTVVSIFVNPLQFNDPKDLERYPRTLDNDLALLEQLGTDEVLAPPASDLYPQGHLFAVEAADTTKVMEGLHRPGFLRGVMTIVLKLLNLVRADRAYFGEKDYQQLKTITDMVHDFFVSTEIIGCPTVRSESGLAESSRNALLSSEGRRVAAVIFSALSNAKTAEEARAIMENAGLRIDYVEEHWGRRFAAVFLEGVRLIDNVPVA